MTLNNYRTSLICSSGGSTWPGAISAAGSGLNVLNASGAALTLSGGITGVPGFTGSVLIRGTSNGTISGVIDLGPDGNVAKTDTGTWTIGNGGNTWKNTGVFLGTLTIGSNDTLPLTTALTMGQNDSGNATFDLNGFNQTVGSLALSSTGGTKQITNSVAVARSLTVDNISAVRERSPRVICDNSQSRCSRGLDNR